MLNMTKFALRRPVSTVLLIVTLLYFGVQSLFSTKLELTPEMEMPMMIVSTVYAGASPEDINDLISTEIEDAVSSLDDVDTVMSYSMENVSIVIVQYEYGTDMDTAYIDLKKAVDLIKSDLPDEAEESQYVEMDIDAMDVMSLAIGGDVGENLYNYVDNNIVPEFEKLSSVGSVSLAGGQEAYAKVELIPEQMDLYGLNMTTIAQIVGAADFTVPAGKVDMGEKSLSVSVENEYDSVEFLGNVPIPLASGDIIHLSDVANVYEALEEKDSIGRYNGIDVISIGIQKQQGASAVDVSKDVNKEIADILEKNPGLTIDVVNDSSDMIVDSLNSVKETMIMAVILSMIVLFVFFGEWRASVIVGTSIPLSIIVALICITAMGFSMNVISMGSLVLGVGMMVDNSIVVLESCFRALDKEDKKNGFVAYANAALNGTKTVIGSVIGSTVTTCVVFLPLALLDGMSGQLFVQLGFTIIFCMVASLISAVTIVPLCFRFLRPQEKEDIPIDRILNKVIAGYRKLIDYLLDKKLLVIGGASVLLAGAFFLASKLDIELMVTSDEGIVNLTIETNKGTTLEENDRIFRKVEEMVAADEEVDRYLLTYGDSGLAIGGGGTATLMAYLKDDTKYSSDEMIAKWKNQVTEFTECTITLEKGSSTGMSSMMTDNIEIDIAGTNYDDVRDAADEFVKELRTRKDVSKIHSSAENAAPVIKVNVDPVKANAEGLTPAAIGGTLYTALSGSEVGEITVNGSDLEIKVEYADDEYDTADKMKAMLIDTPAGRKVSIGDLADIYMADSPQTIQREDKKYLVAVTAEPVVGYEKTAERDIKALAASWEFPEGVGLNDNAQDETMNEEFASLGSALLTAVFLVFIVMAIQFESPKMSLIVMFTIPFALIGAFLLLYLADSPISMVSLLGMLMMVGTVVNNGILYVDTATQYRAEMPLRKALIEAGATRIRPILMTTLTTVLSMLPQALAYGESGAMLQGLALVNIGGLTTSTILSLILLPTLYLMFDKYGRKRTAEKGEIDYD